MRFLVLSTGSIEDVFCLEDSRVVSYRDMIRILVKESGEVWELRFIDKSDFVLTLCNAGATAVRACWLADDFFFRVMNSDRCTEDEYKQAFYSIWNLAYHESIWGE